MTSLGESAAGRGPWAEFWTAPPAVRVYLAAVGVAAVVLPFGLRGIGPHDPSWADVGTATMLVLVSVLNVEIGRRLAGGLARTHQPHKALSAWAFASALLLPTPWLLVVVPLTYAHARWRGIRVPLWKWFGSGAYLVLAALAAAATRHATLGDTTNWMAGDGRQGILAMLVAALAFLAVESLLFAGSAVLGSAEDEAWLRQTLSGMSFYATEVGVLLIGGLLAAVWTGGAWFVLLFVPIYALGQRAALHEPLRERAETAMQLAARNHDLELANQFKIDLMGVLGHEIGNPLTAILAHAEMGPDAADSGDTAFVSESFAVMARNAHQIRRVLHDLLGLVSSDRGALTAYPEPTRLHPHLTAAATSQRPEARPTVECPEDLSVLVQPGHLDQMLANLLTNAVKYAGGASRVTARTDGAGVVEISVVDHGPGVPEAFRDHLFERFSREADTAGKVMGAGLGLFITRELARANGGDVTHRPAHPRGAQFSILLPQGFTQPSSP
ncbi:sensor histidine kinase [Nocardioides astragali]|uniref:histidine kinase n=1 Tax=Nocardioides astragali TaxID=1776736 RepID=A0ABW2NAT1_9ACTN|nr:HAMP domain-containing sensor histidine kinase [Nocardioides astragali]